MNPIFIKLKKVFPFLLFTEKLENNRTFFYSIYCNGIFLAVLNDYKLWSLYSDKSIFNPTYANKIITTTDLIREVYNKYLL